MSREIKFRAWNPATKIMIDLKKITPLALNMDTDGLFLPFSDGIPLMQFTGLLDKNKKEIYEGDILQCQDDGFVNQIFTCEWGIHKREMKSGIEVDIPGFAFIKSDGRHSFPIVKNYLGKHDLEIIEVIGNIWENPELLTPSNG